MKTRTDMDVARDLCIFKSWLLAHDMAPTATLIGEAAEHLVGHAVAAALRPAQPAQPLGHDEVAAEVNRVLGARSRFPRAGNVVELYPGIGAARR